MSKPAPLPGRPGHVPTAPYGRLAERVHLRPADLAAGLGIVGLLLSTVVLTYWPTIADLARDWQRDENYSVGQLVPLAALYLVWQERRSLLRMQPKPCWWGAGLIVAAQAMRFYGLLDYYQSAERYSLVLTVMGLVLLIGGWRIFRQLIWVQLFLLLMVPLPGKIHNLISGPLQNLATVGAVFLLELVGVTVTHRGNVILLDDTVELAVAEACSGLRMLTAFVVVAATLAYIIHRPRWQKITLLLSSIPVAIACNLIRLFVTAELYRFTSSVTAEKFFHDFAGLTMMPIAVLMLMGEIWLMDKLVTSPAPPPARRKRLARGTRPADA